MSCWRSEIFVTIILIRPVKRKACVKPIFQFPQYPSSAQKAHSTVARFASNTHLASSKVVIILYTLFTDIHMYTENVINYNFPRTKINEQFR